MTKQDVSKNVKERIKQVARINSSAVVRGELMKRNLVFKKQLNQTIRLTIQTNDEWHEFCRRWGIAEEWNGDLETLADHASALPWIYLNLDDKAKKEAEKRRGPELKAYGYAPGIRNGWHAILDDLKSTMLDRGDKPYPNGEIYVRIFPWTTRKDLNYLWRELDYDKKKVFGFAFDDREKRTFARDLCFYDLHTGATYGKMSDGRIVAAWYQHTGKRVNRDTVKKARTRIAANVKAFTR